jgi:hypothetical protein
MKKMKPDVRLPQAPLSKDNLSALKKVMKDYGLI